MYMSYFIFIYPEKPSVLRRCSVRAVVRWRCGSAVSPCQHNAAILLRVRSSGRDFA